MRFDFPGEAQRERLKYPRGTSASSHAFFRWEDVTDRVVDSHIGNPRRKLDDLAPGQNFIHAGYGTGHRFEIADED
jgi:DNA-binding response OmpR family regulator